MEYSTKKEAISTYLNKENIYEYQLINGLKISLLVKQNVYNIPLNNLFSLATRKNPKRSFLFVSRLLGKHIPVDPCTYQLAGRALALRLLEEVYFIKDEEKNQAITHLLMNQDDCGELHRDIYANPLSLPEPMVFLGFAETATGLGYGMFDSFNGDCNYIHTTREVIPNIENKISFSEEHSHASSHYIYNVKEQTLKNDKTIVLVDDELTTGKTALNIIDALQKKYARKKYVVATILDWRSEEDQRTFDIKAKELGVSIQVISLLQGQYQLSWTGTPFNDTMPIKVENANDTSTDANITYYRLDETFRGGLDYTSVNEGGEENRSPYLMETGRFGICGKNKEVLHIKLKDVGESLEKTRRGKNTLCLGMGEFIYIPMVISSWMGRGIKYHSTTRSPIYPCNKEYYAIKNAFKFQSPEDPSITNYLYNIPVNYYDELYLFIERQIEESDLQPLLTILKGLGIPNINIVTCIGKDVTPVIGSYHPTDVTFLLKDISKEIEEKGTEDREEAIQSGTHYSEMLPLEYKPSKEYINLFHLSLKETAEKLAVATGVVAEKILRNKEKDIVLVSLARAGTPVGILVKRYIKFRYGVDLPHYSISIIRGKGFDLNALKYIFKYHPGKTIQFIDGWTGKGAIANVLIDSCNQVQKELDIQLDPDLAVLADPAHCTATFGSREDFLIPSACLNATVSGLISRTVHRRDLIGEEDFHGVKYYKELLREDVSNLFVDTISNYFPLIVDEVNKQLQLEGDLPATVSWKGLEDIKKIQEEFKIEDINLIKPGIGETTRVLLRRVPWKILVKEMTNENLNHILVLAKEKGVMVELYPNMTYQCCGLIKPLRGDAE